MKSFAARKQRVSIALLVAAIGWVDLAGASHAAEWNFNGNDAWSNGARWNGGVPDGIDAVADFSQVNINGDRTVTLDSNRTVGTLIFGDNTTPSNNWIIGGTATLTLQTSTGQPTINVVNQQGRINAPLLGNQGFKKTGAGDLLLDPEGPVLIGGIDVQQGKLRVSSNTDTNRFGNNRLSVATGATIQMSPSANAISTYSREIAGEGVLETLINSTNYTTLRTFILQDATFSGSAATPNIDATERGGFHLMMSGIGTWTLTGSLASALRGPSSGDISTVRSGELRLSEGAALSNTVISSNETLPRFDIQRFGTLTLDNTASNVDRVNNTTDIFAFGGKLRLIGNSVSATSETLERFGSRVGTATTVDVIRNSQDVTLNLGTTYIDNDSYRGLLNITSNGTLGGNVKVTGSGTSHGSEGTALRRVFANGTDFAKYDATNGFLAFSPGDYLTPASINAAPGSSSVVLMDNSMATKSLSASKTLAALKLHGDAAYTLDLVTHTLTLGGNGGQNTFQLLKTGSETVTINGGTLSPGGSSTFDLIMRVHEGTLIVNSAINLPNTAQRFVKAGEGLLVLNGAFQNPDSTDILYFAEGTIRMNPLAAGLSGPRRVFNGGVMEITGIGAYAPTFGTGGNEVSLASGGGFAAFGGDVALSTPITWAAANQVADGVPLLLNSTTADSAINLSGTLDLAGAVSQLQFREIRVADNASSTTDKAIISGQIIGASNQSHLLKTGVGLLELTNANNTYLGETYVHAGRLNVNGTLSAVAAPSHATVTAMDGATLGGTGVINRPVVAQDGSFVAPGTSAGSLEIGSTFDLLAGATLQIELGGTIFDLNVTEQYDRVKVAGLTTLAGDLAVSLIDGFDLGANQFFGIVDANGNVDGLFANYANGDTVLSSNGFDLLISYTGLVGDVGTPSISGGNDIVLYTVSNTNIEAVPEPSSWAMLCVAAVIVGFSLARIKARRK